MTSSAPPAETAVAVFAKAPVPGAVKTRLAPSLGPEGAANLHALLTRRALEAAVAAGIGPVELWCAPDERHPFFQECAERFGVALCMQSGDDLGARMRNAFDTAFAARRSLVLIGSDCAALTPAHLREAAAALAENDAAVIPAEDGGYVLLALSRPVESLFEDIAWGGDGVMGDTRARFARAGVRWRELPALWDVDRPEDFARLRLEGLLVEAPC